ncbi:MAG: hypothetical protein CMB20_003550 [Methanobacteriota archaeon]|nr:MAG: hypothetical protein CMB20_003550 [Euryarchaeota archaeon]
MWPSFSDGDVIECETYSTQEIEVEDLVVFLHPLKKNVTCVKRVKSILENGLFVQGDNSDPLASEDSHNFGPIKESAIIAILKS